MPHEAVVTDPFYQAVVDALEKDQLTLPTLPDVALRIRDACESPDATAVLISNELARDPAMAARVLRVSNSAALGATRRIDSLQTAVTRLGREMTRLLVTGFAVEQAFACKSPELKLRLRSQWALSVEVAALSRALASHSTKLKPDMAMLAGLTCDIGSLALIRTADQQKAVPGPAEIERVMERFSADIGKRVLKAWDFPAPLPDIPEQALDFQRWHGGPPDYADVVTVALLQCDATGPRRWWSLDRVTVPAFTKLNLNSSVESLEMEGLGEEIAEANQLLAA